LGARAAGRMAQAAGRLATKSLLEGVWEERAVACRFFRALGPVGGVCCGDALVLPLLDPHVCVRREVMQTLRELLQAGMDLPRLAAAYVARATLESLERGDREERVAACRLLPALGRLPAYHEAIDRAVCWRNRSRKMLRALLKAGTALLRDPDTDVRREALLVFCELLRAGIDPPAEDLGELLQARLALLRDRDADVRTGALLVLSELLRAGMALPTPLDLQAARAAAASMLCCDGEERAAACGLLCTSGPHAAGPIAEVLVARLGDQDGTLAKAAQGLRELLHAGIALPETMAVEIAQAAAKQFVSASSQRAQQDAHSLLVSLATYSGSPAVSSAAAPDLLGCIAGGDGDLCLLCTELVAGVLREDLLHHQDAAGNSPLHLAALAGHRESCQKLLQAGALAGMKNGLGHRPIDIAREAGFASLVRYFEGADFLG